ncbi:hypothetical protein CVP05_05925 [Conservatibacter flavescens]|uniref:Uncharacterized protein n=1 Tax=Conservatibacter flavescens TaxID=28161 RepID=A0A2M8S2V6_9PAST|nr:hypothetical protein CVP05_05925 [Conservatibacter flavescens]
MNLYKFSKTIIVLLISVYKILFILGISLDGSYEMIFHEASYNTLIEAVNIMTFLFFYSFISFILVFFYRNFSKFYFFYPAVFAIYLIFIFMLYIKGYNIESIRNISLKYLICFFVDIFLLYILHRNCQKTG